MKEHFVSIGLRSASRLLGVLARPRADTSPAAGGVDGLVAFIVWWAFLVGHVMTNIMGFGA